MYQTNAEELLEPRVNGLNKGVYDISIANSIIKIDHEWFFITILPMVPIVLHKQFPTQNKE